MRTCTLTCIPTYIRDRYLPTCLPTYPPTHLPTHPATYLLTYADRQTCTDGLSHTMNSQPVLRPDAQQVLRSSFMRLRNAQAMSGSG